MMATTTQRLVAAFLCVLSVVSAGLPFSATAALHKSGATTIEKAIPLSGRILARGGGLAEEDQQQSDSAEERYSRQVYTLGQRAHGLIRSATIYLDGPLSSGLLYECAKNLALSGVGNIVILNKSVTESSDDEAGNEQKINENYHYSVFDDLGKSYQRAARIELGVDGDDTVDDATILQRFLQRLNPSVRVSIMDDADDFAKNGVLVAVDRPHTTQVRLNKECREAGMKFVSIETAGVYGKTFCDMGPNFSVFDADGEQPLDIPLDKLEVIEVEEKDGTIKESLVVNCVDGERHDVSRGDLIEFRSGSGEALPDSNCEVVQVKTPTEFTIEYSGDLSIQEFCDQANAKSASVRRLKVPQTVEFSDLESSIAKAYSDDSSLFAICDLDKSFDANRRGAILSSFQALGDFVAENGCYPTISDKKAFSSGACAANEANCDNESWQSIVKSFAKTCKGKLTPVQAVLGAIGAQEALKAVSGLYTPIQQFLLFDCDELVQEDSEEEESENDVNIHSKGQAYVLGASTCQVLADKKIFVVGAGAIGCELLKNLAAMGATRLVVTDMDTIEHSNLSRQLLFRDSDIGSFKSAAAQKGIARFSSAVEMEVHTSKVGGEENGPFDDSFWSKKIDIVLNALDNVDARLFVDSQCVAYQKALVDAGTLGSKGNVQVVVPFHSESYGSSVDPPEPAIPVCTLKNFPYLIAHTIQWGRDLFDGFYNRRPKQANELVIQLQESSEDQVVEKMMSELGEVAAIETATELLQDLRSSQLTDDLSIRDKAIEWAAQCADKFFRYDIESLLKEHPIDSVDDDGDRFWTGSRRAPRAIRFQNGPNSDDPQQAKANENLLSFVQNCAQLRIEALNPASKDDGSSKISREEAESFLVAESFCEASKKNLDSLMKDSMELVDEKRLDWSQTDFEKDDDSNGHVDFVAAASNLRAICYGIAPVDSMETRRVAGQIVPAMITTTGLVSALSCIELLKLVQQLPLKRHRNAFINLALPFFAFTQPVPAETTPGVGDQIFTLWDRTVIKESKKRAAKGGIKLKKLLSRVVKKIGLNGDSFRVATVSYGPYMLYASFMHEDDVELLNKPIWAVIADALQAEEEFDGRDGPEASTDVLVEALGRKRFVDLSVIIEDAETGDEFEIPPVRILRGDSNTDL